MKEQRELSQSVCDPRLEELSEKLRMAQGHIERFCDANVHDDIKILYIWSLEVLQRDVFDAHGENLVGELIHSFILQNSFNSRL